MSAILSLALCATVAALFAREVRGALAPCATQGVVPGEVSCWKWGNLAEWGYTAAMTALAYTGSLTLLAQLIELPPSWLASDHPAQMVSGAGLLWGLVPSRLPSGGCG